MEQPSVRLSLDSLVAVIYPEPRARVLDWIGRETLGWAKEHTDLFTDLSVLSVLSLQRTDDRLSAASASAPSSRPGASCWRGRTAS